MNLLNPRNPSLPDVRDFDGAGVSHSATENLPGPSVEALKLELKRRLAEGAAEDLQRLAIEALLRGLRGT